MYPATSGGVDVTGNIVPLLGLNAGANPDLAAADNINLPCGSVDENRRLQS